MQESIEERERRPIDITEFDTIVVPAREDGFQETFVGENQWYSIRIHASMIPQIKYIAAYRVAPVSAITHWALVKNIEPWEDTGKFVVNFVDAAKEIGPIPLVPKAESRHFRVPDIPLLTDCKEQRLLTRFSDRCGPLVGWLIPQVKLANKMSHCVLQVSYSTGIQKAIFL